MPRSEYRLQAAEITTPEHVLTEGHQNREVGDGGRRQSHSGYRPAGEPNTVDRSDANGIERDGFGGQEQNCTGHRLVPPFSSPAKPPRAPRRNGQRDWNIGIMGATVEYSQHSIVPSFRYSRPLTIAGLRPERMRVALGGYRRRVVVVEWVLARAEVFAHQATQGKPYPRISAAQPPRLGYPGKST